MNLLKSNRGAAPTLAIFLIFVAVSSGIVVAHLQSIEERQISPIQLSLASDATQARLSSINSELNSALQDAAAAAAYDVGMAGGTKEEVEDTIIDYLNKVIEKDWGTHNISVTLLDEDSINEKQIQIRWEPNGSLAVRVYLENSKVEHVKGPTAYGTFLNVSTYHRFRRLEYIADNQIDSGMSSSDIKDLDEKYECEGIDIIWEEGNITIEDNYGGKQVYL